MENMESGLKKALEQIQKGGLPSTGEMRAQVAGREKAVFAAKLSEYSMLFDRFKAGEVLTDVETKRMAELSDELGQMTGRSSTGE